MKTIQEIDNAIAQLQKDGEDLLKTSRQYKALGAKAKNLFFLRKYLETNPSLEFIESEKARVKNLIRNFEDRSKDMEKIQRDKFFKINGVPELKKQLKTLNQL